MRVLFALMAVAGPLSIASPTALAQTRPVAEATEVVEPAAPVTATPEAEEQTIVARRAEQAAEVRVEQVRASRSAVEQVLELELANEEVGELLREARRRAPEPVTVLRQVAARERELAEVKLDRVRLLEQRRLTQDPAERERLTVELAKQEAYQAALEEALAAERELALEVTRLVERLDGQLLWIGSAPPVGPAWIADIAAGTRWILDPGQWAGAGRTLLRRLADTPLLSLAATLLVGVLLFSRLKLRRRLDELGRATGRYATDSFVLTVRAMIATILIAMPVPLALFAAGGLLATQSRNPFAQALGNGLIAAGAVYVLLNVFRVICRTGGVADTHFEWNGRARRTLSINLGWLLAVEVPVAAIVATCDAGGEEIYRQGLGRLAFMVGSTGLTVFVARVFRPDRGVFSDLLARDGWAWRLRRVWYSLLVLLPATLTLAAAVGYYFTATEVISRFFATGVVVLAGTVLYSLLARWLLVARRRLAIRQARQRLLEQREARQRKGDAEAQAASGDAVPELETQAVDVEAASSQTLSLLRTGVAAGVLALLWAVWNDVVPALAVLEQVELTGATVDTEGSVIVPAVTLWSLLLGLFAVVLTIVAARNLPAVLELVVLQRFPLDSGTRYAMATLARYLVIAIGIVVASNLLGIEWGRAQWIVAALGVGLGFGLQEIVANFVSGLIILFERPVRVGDVVTVGDVSGTVSRLQIRATTITDWDNKEVLVPNKSFITDPVVNWTLSNPVTRLLIPVGVAYGSDVVRAYEAISRAVREVPAVLDDPAPSVLFMGFGESSLDFEVRAFVGELGKRLLTTHELHTAINAALRDAGIEIPFPQRDLHLKTDDIGRLAKLAPTSPTGATSGSSGRADNGQAGPADEPARSPHTDDR